MLYVQYAVEGRTDQPIAEKLLQVSGLNPYRPLITDGKANLDEKLPGLNRSARQLAWLVIRDLDRDDRNSCVPDLRVKLLNGPANRGMCFRLAVRSSEAWLMADSDSFTDFFAVGKRVPADVDELPDPKRVLTDLCRKSQKREIREGVPPRLGSGRRVGPEYVAVMQDFVQQAWCPDRARQRSPSLERALTSLDRLKDWVESRTISTCRAAEAARDRRDVRY